MSKVFASVIVVTLTIGALFATATAAPAPPTSDALTAEISQGAYCASPVEVKFLNLINQYRTSKDRAPLGMSQTVGAAARHHSVDMAKRNYFDHDTKTTNATFVDRLNAHGYPYTGSTALGENIYSGGDSASEAFNAWKKSSRHNANMLSTKFTTIGIGRGYNANSTYKYYWTTDFAGKFDAAAKRC